MLQGKSNEKQSCIITNSQSMETFFLLSTISNQFKTDAVNGDVFSYHAYFVLFFLSFATFQLALSFRLIQTPEVQKINAGINGIQVFMCTFDSRHIPSHQVCLVHVSINLLGYLFI